MPFKLSKGSFDTNLNILLDENRNIIVGGKLLLKSLFFTYNDIVASGNVKFDFDGNITNKKLSDYSVQALLEKVDVSGLPYIHSIDNLSGKIKLEKEILSTEDLNCTVLGNSVSLRGSLEGFKNTVIKAIINSKIDIASTVEQLPERIAKKLKKISFTKGTADTNLKLNGKVKYRQNLSYTLDIDISDMAIKHADINQPFSDINGKVSIEKDSVISALGGVFNQSTYELNAKVINFKEPDISFTLKSNDALIDSECTLLDRKLLNISKLKGKIFDSSFEFIGEVNPFESAFNVYGDVLFNLKDLKNFLPNISDLCDKYKFEGTPKFTIFLKGQDPSWKNWEMALKAKSDEIKFLTFKFKDFYTDLKLKDRVIKLSVLNLKPYEGLLLLRGNVDLTKENFPYYFDIDLTGFDINKFIQDTQLEKKNISGDLSLKTLLNGYATDFDSLNGKGWIKIADGNLWEISFLKGLSEILFMPNLRTVVFKEGFSNFEISDRKISTPDATLIGDDLSLVIVGNIDFDTNLDLIVTSSLSSEYEDEDSTKRVKTFVLDKLGRLVGEVHVTGTLKEPKYKIKPIRPDKVIIDKFKGFFQEILD